jgi:hypothetical protein
MPFHKCELKDIMLLTLERDRDRIQPDETSASIITRPWPVKSVMRRLNMAANTREGDLPLGSASRFPIGYAGNVPA